MEVIKELVKFLWERKKIWLIPLVIILFLVGILILVSSITGISPFIYPLF
ncbi:MAG: DUF5989 family protein [Candidatus Omnitrophica bacterium]|nr:DUF5989 family protein [Candidatus Omnitrophota bacterium]